jgi:hypothetical protein
MTQVFEFAAFAVRKDQEQDLIAERPVMLAALHDAFPGLMSAWLTQRDDGSWLDVILRRSHEEARHAATHVNPG